MAKNQKEEIHSNHSTIIKNTLSDDTINDKAQTGMGWPSGTGAVGTDLITTRTNFSVIIAAKINFSDCSWLRCSFFCTR